MASGVHRPIASVAPPFDHQPRIPARLDHQQAVGLGAVTMSSLGPELGEGHQIGGREAADRPVEDDHQSSGGLFYGGHFGGPAGSPKEFGVSGRQPGNL